MLACFSNSMAADPFYAAHHVASFAVGLWVEAGADEAGEVGLARGGTTRKPSPRLDRFRRGERPGVAGKLVNEGT